MYVFQEFYSSRVNVTVAAAVSGANLPASGCGYEGVGLRGPLAPLSITHFQSSPKTNGGFGFRIWKRRFLFLPGNTREGRTIVSSRMIAAMEKHSKFAGALSFW